MEIMDVQVQRTFVVPPVAAPSEEVPLTVFDLAAPTYHVTVLFTFSPPNPTNQALLDALFATLPRFPLLTAAMRRRAGTRPCFVTGEGGAGALVVEAEVPSSALAQHLPLAPSPGLALLHPAVHRGAAPHVLMLQINRFACGGIVIASSSHHQVADGHSMNMFLHAWADAVRGDDLDIHCAHVPMPYGPAALVPHRPPRCEFEHRGAEFLPLSPARPHDNGHASKPPAEDDHHVDTSEITNMLLHYTSEFVAELKCAAHNSYTTFETVSAHVWRKITSARGLTDARTSILIAVNGRGRLAGMGALPAAGFFGNVVLTATSGTRAAALATGTLADAAALVRAGIRDVDCRYFQSFVDFGALHADEELKPAYADEAGVLSPDVEAISWLHLDLHRLDFGSGGRLVGILPGKVPQDGVVVLMPSLRKGGGIDVFVALWDNHARELRAIAYTMD